MAASILSPCLDQPLNSCDFPNSFMGLGAGAWVGSLGGERSHSYLSPLGELGVQWGQEKGRHQPMVGLDLTSFLPKGLRGCPCLGGGAAVDPLFQESRNVCLPER